MKPHRRRRLGAVAFIAAALGASAALVLYALGRNIDLFYTPSQVAAGEVAPERRVRIGGMVREGSVERAPDSLLVRFTATDYASDVRVRYEGVLPDLFREGQGVVAEGRIGPDGVFLASRVLAKHDENYMSPEVKAALDAAGASPENHAMRARPED